MPVVVYLGRSKKKMQMTTTTMLCAAGLLLVLLSPWDAVASAAAANNARRRYDSIFGLGDSFTDTGNNPAVFGWYNLTDPVTRSPYGSTFFRRPTGRNCDGRLIIDFIAEGLGLPLVPPYLGPPFASPSAAARNGSLFRQGASLAVGGATALDVEFYHSRGIPPGGTKFPLNTSLNVQLDWFDSLLKPSLCRTTQECAKLLGRSLFFVGEFGVNDYQFAFHNIKDEDIRSSVAPSIIDNIRQAIERLIKAGAKALVVPGVIPLGCSPLVLNVFPEPDTSGYDSKTGCILKYNEVGRYHYTLLQESLEKIRANHSDVKIIYADFFNPIMDMIESPRMFGMRQDVLTVCCGGLGKHNYNISVPCGDSRATKCKDPSASVYWDGVHFTEAANHHIATNWLSSINSGAKSS